MSQQRALKPLTQGALLAAVTALLGIISLGFPPIRFISDFLWGVPVIIVITNYNLRLGIMVTGVSLLLLLFMFNPVTVLLFAVRMVPLAIGYGILVKKGTTAGRSLIIGTLIAVVSEVLTILGFLYLAGINVIPAEAEIRQQINESIEFYKQAGLMELYARQGISEEKVKDLFYQFTHLYILLIPAGMILGSIIRAFLTWVASQKVMKRLGYAVKSLPSFTEWSLPWYWIWFLIVGLLMAMTGDRYNVTNLALVGKNIVAVVIFLYLIIGLAIATSFFRKWKVPYWFKVLMVIVAVMNMAGTIVLFAILGIFDAFIVFRRFGEIKNK